MLFPTSVKMPPELHQMLKSLAESQHRSMSNLIIHILTEYVENKKED